MKKFLTIFVAGLLWFNFLYAHEVDSQKIFFNCNEMVDKPKGLVKWDPELIIDLDRKRFTTWLGTYPITGITDRIIESVVKPDFAKNEIDRVTGLYIYTPKIPDPRFNKLKWKCKIDTQKF